MYSSRNEFIADKYVRGKFIKGDKEVDPWSFLPLRDVEIEVLELEVEKPEGS